jgi:glycine cleavage system H lipoate-binding protein
VQKPFTEDELLAFVKKSLIRRQDKIQKMLKPTVRITHLSALEATKANEFAIPGGVFIAPGHTWAAVGEDGETRIGIDDFAKKLIGKVDEVILPNLGMAALKGQPLFTVRSGKRRIDFRAPVSGKVVNVNSRVAASAAALDKTPYEDNWICIIDADRLDAELPDLKIGNAAVTYYQDELERFRALTKKFTRTAPEGSDLAATDEVYAGELQDLVDRDYEDIVSALFAR